MISEIRQNNFFFQLYSSGIEVFKSYPFFGVGNKNYRVETCKTRAFPVKKKENEKYIFSGNVFSVLFRLVRLSS